MITKIEIKDFKCFKHLTVNNLKPITIIGGKNNAGKSALLDAILVQNVVKAANYFIFLFGIRNPNIPQILTSNLLWNPLFYDTNNTNEFSIKYERDNSKVSTFSISKKYGNDTPLSKNQAVPLLWQNYSENDIKKSFSLYINFDIPGSPMSGECFIQDNNLQMKSEINPPLPKWSFEEIFFYKNLTHVSSIPEWVSQTILNDEKNKLLVQTLKHFDNNITKVTTVIENNISAVYVKLNSGQIIPINAMGDGINKALAILLCIINLPNGILVIDEIENGFHYSLYKKLLKIFCETALNVNCQLIMTTHNRNIIGSILTSMEEMERLEDLSYQRMDFSKGRRQAFHFSGQDLINSFEMNMEIR